jgi:ribonuclease R
VKHKKPRKEKSQKHFDGNKPARKPKDKKFRHETRPDKPRSEGPRRIVGVLTKSESGWRLQSTNRRERGDYILHAKTNVHLEEGHLAIGEEVKGRGWAKEAKLIDILGDVNAPRAVSLIAIATHDIPSEFPKAAHDEANQAKPVTLDNRTDLRDIPLVTIDGEDARDFDDAVFAEPHNDGWHLIVAIADVAHYVKSGSALDETAYKRGNSVYFPDRVVPMLPEALSNELCSLKPHVERACMAAHMWLDKAGELTRWQFVRGVMKSKARLTYAQVQHAIDGKSDDTTTPLLDPVLKNLYAAYKCLIQARLKRGTLELDLPERKVAIGEDGKLKSITIRDRFDSHKLIEEFMICANVAAAAQLEGKGGVCLYRVHDKPSEMKLEGLRDFLDTLGISLVPMKQLHPRFLTQILENSAGTPHAQVVNEMMLRSQAQAIYSPENIGHFGLALAKYAHFTSPIRRYADLIVHRGLIRACNLGDDGITSNEIDRLEKIAEHISTTERRAAAAERDATDRYITLFMADRVGATFPARVSGVARFGIFARLEETGADGIIPINTLPHDYYFHDEKRQALVGKRTGRVFQLAQQVNVKLEQADRLTGSMAFSIVEDKDENRPANHHSGKQKKRRK